MPRDTRFLARPHLPMAVLALAWLLLLAGWLLGTEVQAGAAAQGQDPHQPAPQAVPEPDRPV